MVIIVLIPAGWGGADAWAGAGLEVALYGSAGELSQQLRGSFDGAVLVSDGIAEGDLGEVASAVAASGRPVIEVRTERWDGKSPSALSAACRGVISGFGRAGVGAAVEALRAG